MAISAGDFRTGLTLIVDGDPWQVLDFQHVKPGKGAAKSVVQPITVKAKTETPDENKNEEPENRKYTGKKL